MSSRISEARRALVLDFPFFGVLALKLEIKEGAHITKTCATDGKRLFFNPAFVERLTRQELMGVIAHEVLHCANGHHWRREHRDARLWNDACDLAINQVLVDAGLALPSSALINEDFAGMSAEAIYDRLLQQKMADETQAQAETSSGEDESEGESAGGGPGDQKDEDGQPGGCDEDESDNSQDGGNQSDGDDQGDVDDSDGAGSQDTEPDDDRGGQGGEQPEPTHDTSSNFGEVLDAPAEERDSTRQEWAEALINAARVAKKHGNLPGGIDRMVEAITNPPQDWRALLRRFIQNLAADDYTWRMPNARYLHAGLYMPRLQSESMPEIVVAVDTSGSIDDRLLSQFEQELRAIINEAKPERTHLLTCNAVITSARTFERGEPLEILMRGGGGTDFQPVFEWVEEHGVNPVCLVYLTDLDGAFPSEAPGYPVLWMDFAGYSWITPPFGERIEIRV